METSILVAKILGVAYIAIGLGMLLNPAYYYKMYKELLKDSPLMYISAFVPLVVGILLITYHNIWEYSWVVIITVIGWLAFIKGLFLLVIPKALIKLSQSWLKAKGSFGLIGFIVLVLGLVLCYFGCIEKFIIG